MNPLGKLIRSRMEERGWTYKDVVTNSGGAISLAGVHALVSKAEHRQPPRPSTLEALAKGLQYPLDVVQLAAAEAAGYKLTPITTTLEGATTLKIIAAAQEDLTPEQHERLARLVQSKIEEMKTEGRRKATGC